MKKTYHLTDAEIYVVGDHLDEHEAEIYDKDISVCSGTVHVSLELDEQFRVLSSVTGTFTVKCPSFHITGGDGFIHEFEHDELEKEFTIQSFETVYISGQLHISDEEFTNDKIEMIVNFIDSEIEIELNS